MQDPILTPIFVSAGVTGSLSVGAATISYASLLSTTVLIGATIGLQLALQPDVPKPEDGHAPVKQAITPRQFAYGRVRLSGVYAFYEEAGGHSYDIIALHQGKICGFSTFFLHDDEVYFSGIAGENRTIAGPVKTELRDKRYEVAKVSISFRFGEETETAYSTVTASFPTLWTSSHRGDGVASLMLRCIGVNANHFQEEYPHGLPQPSAVIEGLALWDPRDEAQDPNDPETWVDYPVWSDATTYAAGARVLYESSAAGAPFGNLGVYISRSSGNLNHNPDTDPEHWVSAFHNPVLQLLDYLTDTDHGMGLDRATLIDPVIDDWVEQANLCDVLVEKADGSSEPRYSSSGFATFETNPEQVIGAILAACDGWIDESGDGTLSLSVGVYQPPTVTIEARHIVGFSISYGLADEQTVNELTISFTSPDDGYKEIAGDPWRNETDITARGLRRSQGLSLLWVQSHSQSRRLAKRAMARLSAPLRGSFTTKLWGLSAVGHRWVNVQYPFIAGLEDAVVEIQKASIDVMNGRVSFDWLLVDPDTLDAWDADTEEGEAPGDPGTVVSESLPTAENINALAAGTPPFHIDVSWDDPNRDDLDWVIRYRVADDGSGNPGAWTEQLFTNLIPSGGRISASIFPTTDDVYELQIASVGSGGTYGEFEPEPPLLVLTAALALTDNIGAAILDNAAAVVTENA